MSGLPAPLLRTTTSLGPAWAFIGLALLIKVFIVLWIRQDALARGKDPVPWMVAAAAFDLIALIVWVVTRPEERS